MKWWSKTLGFHVLISMVLGIVLESLLRRETIAFMVPADDLSIQALGILAFSLVSLAIISSPARQWWFHRQLHVQIFVCILLGILFGIAFKDHVHYIAPVGDIFIRLLRMLIVPLTLLTLIGGITKLDNIKSLRSIGGATIVYYALSSVIAVAIGMTMALIIKPGLGTAIPTEDVVQVTAQHFDFVDSVVHWIPTNPFEALSQTEMLQIIVFAIIVGIALLAMKERGERLTLIISDAADMMILITEKVITFAPYGILALIANMVASLGFEMLTQVGKFVLAQYISLAILLIIFYPIVIYFFAKLNPLTFYRNISPAMLVAASTTSSGATLPVSMGVAQDNLGSSETVWGFTLPLGATVNMNGMASCIGVIAVFASYLYGMDMTPGSMFQIAFLGLALSVGTAGVKGAGIVISTVLLQTLNVPTVIIVPILASIWPLLDIGNTCTNVTGDLVGTALVSSRVNMLDKDVFYNNRSHDEKGSSMV